MSVNVSNKWFLTCIVSLRVRKAVPQQVHLNTNVTLASHILKFIHLPQIYLKLRRNNLVHIWLPFCCIKLRQRYKKLHKTRHKQSRSQKGRLEANPPGSHEHFRRQLPVGPVGVHQVMHINVSLKNVWSLWKYCEYQWIYLTEYSKWRHILRLELFLNVEYSTWNLCRKIFYWSSDNATIVCITATLHYHLKT